MKLEEQIEVLESIGLQFRDREHVDRILDCYEWWQYQESPFTLLLQHINLWAACERTRICENLVSWDFKGLRHIGWFKAVAQDLAKLSSNQTRFKISNVSMSREEDVWEMEYRLPGEAGPIRRKVVTRYPHKYASCRPAIEIASDFETRSHCFINFSDAEPSLCWLPKNQIGKLEAILPNEFEPITKIA